MREEDPRTQFLHKFILIFKLQLDTHMFPRPTLLDPNPFETALPLIFPVEPLDILPVDPALDRILF